jgi:hypothetical protein
VTDLGPLSDREQAALRRAAVWYFNRHARIIAEEADDFSAHAVGHREDFLDLYAALRKLGAVVPLPDELRTAHQQRAA